MTRRRPPIIYPQHRALERFDADMMLTMRMHDLTYDSFKPAPIGELAKWSYSEGERTPLQRQRWKPREMPIAACPGDQKSTSMAGREVLATPLAEIALRRDLS